MREANQVGSFAGREMIAEKQLIIILIHFCEGLTHVIGIAVCRDKMQLRDIKWPPQGICRFSRV